MVLLKNSELSAKDEINNKLDISNDEQMFHRIIRNKEKILKCISCELISKRRSNIVRHYKRFHVPIEHPRQCCDTTFYIKWDLYKHNLEDHPERSCYLSMFPDKSAETSTRKEVIEKIKVTAQNRRQTQKRKRSSTSGYESAGSNINPMKKSKSLTKEEIKTNANDTLHETKDEETKDTTKLSPACKLPFKKYILYKWEINKYPFKKSVLKEYRMDNYENRNNNVNTSKKRYTLRNILSHKNENKRPKIRYSKKRRINKKKVYNRATQQKTLSNQNLKIIIDENIKPETLTLQHRDFLSSVNMDNLYIT